MVRRDLQRRDDHSSVRWLRDAEMRRPGGGAVRLVPSGGGRSRRTLPAIAVEKLRCPCNAAPSHFASRSVISNDEQLFERFRRDGDAKALGDLFDRVAPTLLRAALHLARDPASAEDLLQSTFLRAIEVRDSWDPTRPLLPWLFGILQNRARHERWQRERAPDPTRLTASANHDHVRASEHAGIDMAVVVSTADLLELYPSVLRLHLA